MKFHRAIVRDVRKTKKGHATMYLDKLSGRPPEYLIVLSPPPYFAEVIGTTLQISHEAVFVQDTLWAKRKSSTDPHIVLATKEKTPT